MAEISGEGGGVTFTSGHTSVHSWTVSYAGDALEITDFADSGLRTYIPGLTGWSGSYDCHFDAANKGVVAGSTGDITLTVSTGAATKFSWSGGIIITGMDVTAPVDGVISQSYTFQGTGALTPSTS